MEKADRDFKAAVIMAVGALAEAFNRTSSDSMTRAYVIGLEGLTAEQVKRSMATALRQSKFMPSPAELRELAGEIRFGDRAELAWIALCKAVERHGAYKSITFDDTLINAAVLSLGGWIDLCGTERKEFDTFFRARFLKTYEALARGGVNGKAVCTRLVGIIEQENALAGYTSDHDRVKALGPNCYIGQVVTVETGLPALPSAPALIEQDVAASASLPRLALKRP